MSLGAGGAPRLSARSCPLQQKKSVSRSAKPPKGNLDTLFCMLYLKSDQLELLAHDAFEVGGGVFA